MHATYNRQTLQKLRISADKSSVIDDLCITDRDHCPWFGVNRYFCTKLWTENDFAFSFSVTFTFDILIP